MLSPKFIAFSGAASTCLAILSPAIALAQSIIPDDSTNTLVNPHGDRLDIQGGVTSEDGANLFHSFEEFGLDASQTANFQSLPDIQNIFGRVNGGNPSLIDGLIQVTGGNSNLYLMNPAGIIFGENAQLNVPADFTATTATGIGFEGGWFEAFGSNDYAALVGTPNAFNFANVSPGSIINYGSLAVGAGANLSLFAGTVMSPGTLQSQGGRVSVVAVPGENLLRLSVIGNVLNLEVSPTDSAFNPRSLPELLTLGKSIAHADTVEMNADGTVALKGSGLRVEGGDLVAGSIISEGGDIFLNSGGDIVTGPLDSSANTGDGSSIVLQTQGDGGSIRVEAQGDITTGDVTASSDLGDAGTIELSSQTGQIETGNIDATSTQGDAGLIVMEAQGDVTTGDLDGAAIALGSEMGDITYGEVDESLLTLHLDFKMNAAGEPPVSPAPAESPVALDLPTTIAVDFASDDRLEFGSFNPKVAEDLPRLTEEAGACLLTFGLMGTESGIALTETPTDRAEAIACYQTNLELARTSGDRSREQYTLYNLATSYYALGNYALALEYHQQRLQVGRSLEDLRVQGEALQGLGDTYGAIGQFDRALEAYQSGLEIARTLESVSLKGEILRDLARVHYARHDYDAALELQQQSLTFALQEAESPEEQRRQQVAASIALNDLGLTHYKLTDYETAIDLLEQSLTLARELGERTIEGRALENLGLTHYARQEYQMASDYHQQSLTIARETDDRHAIARALSNLGSALYRAGRSEEAVTVLLEAIETWESLRQNLGDLDRVAIFETHETTYSTLQEHLVAQNQFHTALEISERGRARAFVELLSGRQKAQVGIDRVNSPDLENIRQIAREQNSTLVSYYLMEEVVEIEGTRQLRDKELYIWVVQPSGEIAFRRSNLNSLVTEGRSLEQLVLDARCFRAGCRRRKRNAPQNQNPPENAVRDRLLDPDLQQLYQLTIAPIADLLPRDERSRITFIPHSSLFLMPLPALQDPTGRYLVEKHTISTAPSIQVLSLTHRQQQRNARRNLEDVLVVGNPTMPAVVFQAGEDPARLAALPGAEEEAFAIADLLGADVLTGDAATEDAIVARMSRSRIIHLATHGLLDDFEGAGLPGAIATAPSALEDGLLASGEIFDLDLSAELVVLSGCHTGQGRLSEDGVVGLSRSFMAAGVPSLVVSLWAVPDRSTSDLMVEFYRQLGNTPDKAQALRQAMLATLETYSNPHHWAAFTLVGES
ncbi:MAG: CHAT domain-containing protein [Cyanobacteriota bacterium]|nr:CHAT domain-containing protein [Cyanobacteriota bacterium]